MAARRLIFVMIVMLLLSSFAAALVPVRDNDDEESSSTTPEPALAAGPDGGRLVEERISSLAKSPPTIRLRLGDQLALTVTSPRSGEIAIPRLGELEDVDKYGPARFNVLPPDARSYEVTFVRPLEPPRRVGKIVVAPRTDAGTKQRQTPSKETRA